LFNESYYLKLRKLSTKGVKMWYRTIIVLTIITVGLISFGNFSKSAHVKSMAISCSSELVYEKVFENDSWWMYVYCDGAIVDKYIIVE
jgi:hypothetical protein